MSDMLSALILGIVEGITEFLPVSSTGHMIIVGHMIGFDGNLAKIFDVVIQLGAILSVLVLYRSRFVRFFTKEGWQLGKGLSAYHVLAGCVPTMAFALLVHSFIKKYLFSPFTVAIGLVLGAILMMAAERKIRGHEAELVQDVDHISLKQALYIGFYQFLSLWPGFSRSGSTIGGALLVGVSRKAGADFTFIMALPIMVVACLYELLKNISALSSGDFAVLGLGFAVAFAVAYFSILWFIGFLNRSTLKSFAVYRILLALFTLWYFYC
ncbi:MAG: undecaprenyl-diphosphate phosphatase [Acidaminococcus sp.]|uniref:undecaprenyl-diphosphate phosphatase n=1 Tax=Acidaminococcus sp. TaxID=1872103 RepID=UPI002A74F9DA|nr:undecaprenyl-diphosphate phosphatase [Acidaminococcus sp.]MDY2738271.1 undecaprenyl-diphosphate phosphatase [Acidaminococcus sp.]